MTDRVPESNPVGARSRRQRARRAIVVGVLAVLVLNLSWLLLLDYGPPRLRDPEYGKRLAGLRDRVQESPERPLVLVLGSSRAAMGVRPGVLPEVSGPIMFNFALAGSGPVMELMAFRRILSDGVKPAAVLIEFWPAFLREDGPYGEDQRIDPARLSPRDWPLVQEYFRDPAGVDRVMQAQRRNPWFGHRRSLLNQVAPRWLEQAHRTEFVWQKIDGWGWLPGRETATVEECHAGHEGAANYYVPLFATYEVSPVADRALRQLIGEVRALGVPVALVYLPESSEFRSMMPLVAQQRAESYLQSLCQELALPLIDTRHPEPGEDLPDGFHLTQSGASIYTQRLAPQVRDQFPLGR